MSAISSIRTPSDLQPKTFSEMFGIEGIISFIKKIRAQPERQVWMLISGPHGSGKSLIASLIHKSMSCENANGIDPCNVCTNCRNADWYIDYADARRNDTREGVLHKLCELAQGTVIMPDQRIFLYENIHSLSSSNLKLIASQFDRKYHRGHMILTATETQELPQLLKDRFIPIRLQYTKQSMQAWGNHIAEKLSIQVVEPAALGRIIDKTLCLPGNLLDYLWRFRFISNNLTLESLQHPDLKLLGAAVDVTNINGHAALLEPYKTRLLEGR